MTGIITKSITHFFIGLLLSILPLLSVGQTTIINYDFNSTTTPLSPVTTAMGVTSTASASKTSTAGSGIISGAGAYVANAAGSALTMTNVVAGSAEYFQFALDGASLPKYSSFKLYVQGYRSATGPTMLTLQYSLDGNTYTSSGNAFSPNNPFSEANFDLSGLTALNAPARLFFRLVASGSNGGTVRVDNFQVQALNTVDPTVNMLSSSAIEAGSPEFALTVGGSNYRSGAVVSFNGQALTTTYNSPTSLTAIVPAAAIATAGNYTVTVTNPAAGSTPSLPATFTVTPALLRWTGSGATASWFNPANWSTGAVPGTTDDVLLDHRVVTASYTVSFDQNTAVSIKSLTVNPGVGDSIFIVVPTTNTVAPAALVLSNTGTSAVALAIYPKGVVTNATGASSGDGIEVAGTGPTVFIYNGGSYRHASSRSHADVAENLSTAAGTEQGIFDFRLPATGPSSYLLSLSARTYGTLILRNRPGAVSSGYGGAGSSLTVQGDLLLGAGVTFSPAIGGTLTLMGNLRSQGTIQFKNASPATTTSQLLVAATKPQTLSGTVLLDTGIGFAINNPAGVTLATTLLLSGSLGLTNGTITTTATNLLTLTSTATLNGGSATSYINGPLVRQTAAGAFSNLVFPLGSGGVYRPIVLNATAQDATFYLATLTEGPAPDYNNLPASTSALPLLTRVSRARSYTITPTPAANNFNGTVTLAYDATDQVNVPNDASFVIGKNSGNGWQNIGNSAVNVTTPAPAGGYASGTITSGTFTSFSTFALASTSADAAINPLPVVLTSFVARRQATDVRLSWATATELHNARFEVQRSLDGQLFTMVANVAGQGTAAQARQYTALDPAAPAAVLYYRLAQIDTDGHTTFSPVVVLTSTTAAVLYPNPAHDRLVVPAPAGTQVRILDLTGRVLQTIALPPSGEVSVAGLPAGIYLLQLGEGAQTLRFSTE